MDKDFLLELDETGRPVLKKRALETGEDETLLRAGFSGGEGEDVPFSPTLLLNADLEDFTREQLLSIGRCELYRAESVRVPSYIRHFSPVVAVMSEDAGFLDRFCSIYGGLLDIVRVQFEKDLAPSISEKGEGLLIQYERPLPLDRERCNLCRKCTPACEPGAITSIPSIDLTLCTFCNRCVELCSRGAIDLHRMERVLVEADVAVMPEDFSLDVPSGLEHLFFQPSTLSELFAKIGAFEVEEAVAHNVEFCAFEPRLRKGCKRCLSACKHGAVRAGEMGMEIEQTRCVECGFCIASCPTGAMEYERFPFRVFTGYFCRLHLEPGATTTIVMGKEGPLRDFWWKNPGLEFRRTFFLEFPQPNALSCLHFLFLYSMGFRRIIIVKDHGNGAEEKDALSKQAALANEIIKGLHLEMDETVSLCDPSALKESLAKEPSVEPSSPDMSIDLPSLPLPENKRDALNILLESLSNRKRTDKMPVLSISQAETFADVRVNDNCSLCLACLNVCSQGALTARESGDLELLFKRGKCVNCGACQEVCPEDAVEIIPGLFLDDDYFSLRALSRDEPMRCKSCGKVFGNKKGFERTMKILREAGRYERKQLEVLYLCDKCRARAMLEDVLGE